MCIRDRIWLAYEATGEEKFKTAALIQVDSFADRIARKVEDVYKRQRCT